MAINNLTNQPEGAPKPTEIAGGPDQKIPAELIGTPIETGMPETGVLGGSEVPPETTDAQEAVTDHSLETQASDQPLESILEQNPAQVSDSTEVTREQNIDKELKDDNDINPADSGSAYEVLNNIL